MDEHPEIAKMMKSSVDSPYCEHKECNDNNLVESMDHFLIKCPKYKSLRANMIDKVKEIYQLNNKMCENMDKKERRKQGLKTHTFIDDQQNVNWLKQFIFAPFTMEKSLRIRIIKITIDFINYSGRFRNDGDDDEKENESD